MKALALLFCCTALVAQVWEGPNVHVMREPRPMDYRLAMRNPSQGHALVRSMPQGADQRLEAPRDLHRPAWGLRLTHWQGVSYAVGVLDHPAKSLRALFLADSLQDGPPAHRLTRHLFRSDDFRTWQPFATYREDPHGQAIGFTPLGNGLFLADSTAPFLVGEAAGSHAVYRRDPDGRMRLDHLVDFGLEKPVYRILREPGRRARAVSMPDMEGWARLFQTPHRGSRGLVLLGLNGCYVVLDNGDGRALRHGELYPGPRTVALGNPRVVVGAAMRADGRLLLALRTEAWLRVGPTRNWETHFAFARREPSNRALALLTLKSGGPDGYRPALDQVLPELAIRWAVLDPATGVLTDVAPPTGFPGALSERQARTFAFRMLPDGNLRWSFGR